MLASLVEVVDYEFVEVSSGYFYWKIEFEKDEAGIWDIGIPEIISLTEETM